MRMRKEKVAVLFDTLLLDLADKGQLEVSAIASALPVMFKFDLLKSMHAIAMQIATLESLLLGSQECVTDDSAPSLLHNSFKVRFPQCLGAQG